MTRTTKQQYHEKLKYTSTEELKDIRDECQDTVIFIDKILEERYQNS